LRRYPETATIVGKGKTKSGNGEAAWGDGRIFGKPPEMLSGSGGKIPSHRQCSPLLSPTTLSRTED